MSPICVRLREGTTFLAGGAADAVEAATRGGHPEQVCAGGGEQGPRTGCALCKAVPTAAGKEHTETFQKALRVMLARNTSRTK